MYSTGEGGKGKGKRGMWLATDGPIAVKDSIGKTEKLSYLRMFLRREVIGV